MPNLFRAFWKQKPLGQQRLVPCQLIRLKKELAVTDLPEKGRETPLSFVSFTFVFDHLKIPLSTNLLELDF